MKHFWRSVLILVLIALVCWGNQARLGALCTQLTDEIAQAQQLAEAEEWDAVSERLASAYDLWKANSVYLYSVLQHDDTDTIGTSFHEAMGFAEGQSREEYLAAGRALMQELNAVYQMETLKIENIL